MSSAPDTRFSKRVFIFSSATLVVSLATLMIFPSTLRSIGSSAFLPHAYCYLYNKQLLTLHLVCDLAIWLSYVAISITLGYLVYSSRREIPFHWMFLAFGVFIIACGFTHFMEVVVLWKPLYWLSGDIKLVTAVASVLTSFVLPSLVPQVQDLVAKAQVSEKRSAELQASNLELSKRESDLESEVKVRLKAEEQLSYLSSRLLRLQDEERRRVARDLHDSTGQTLVALKMTLASLEPWVANQPKPLDILEKLNSYAEQCLKEIRSTSYLLHPPLLDEVGFSSAARWYIEGLGERSGLKSNLQLPPMTLNKNTELVFFRILQESITNVVRHSGSATVDVSLLSANGQVTLTIKDYGRGIPPAKLASFNRTGAGEIGVGLAGMRQRAKELGGKLVITSDQTGTQVTASLPLDIAGTVVTP